MNSKRKKLSISIIIILFIALLFCILAVRKVQNRGIEITIRNKTNISITGMKLTYTNIDKDIEIPVIDANKEWQININLPHNYAEGTMKLYYFDNNNIVEYTIIGYIEKNYTGDFIITINSVNNNGVFNISKE